jgi:5-methylcytosine-specific restriction endonuclease McrA
MTDIELYFQQVETRQKWKKLREFDTGSLEPPDKRTCPNHLLRSSLLANGSEDVKAFYDEAARLTRETGIPHEVDHIFPISRGGAHSASNLRVTTKAENRDKGASIDNEFVFLAQDDDGRWHPIK